MKICLLIIVLGLLLGGCVVKHRTSSVNNVHVVISPFEKARAKSVARQFLTAYCEEEPKDPHVPSASEYMCESITLTQDFENWSVCFRRIVGVDGVTFLYVTVNRDMKRAYVVREEDALKPTPAIDGDEIYRTQRILEDFRRQLAERRKLNHT